MRHEADVYLLTVFRDGQQLGCVEAKSAAEAIVAADKLAGEPVSLIGGNSDFESAARTLGREIA